MSGHAIFSASVPSNVKVLWEHDPPCISLFIGWDLPMIVLRWTFGWECLVNLRYTSGDKNWCLVIQWHRSLGLSLGWYPPRCEGPCQHRRKTWLSRGDRLRMRQRTMRR